MTELAADFTIEVGVGKGDLPDWVSISQLGMMDRCGQQYEYRYLDGLVSPPAVYFAQGDVFHAVSEQQNRHKIKTKKNLTTEDIQDAFADRWKKGGSQLGRDSGNFLSWKEYGLSKNETSAHRNISLAASVTYHEGKAVKMKPTVAEKQILVPFLSRRMFMAYIDCIEKPTKTKKVAVDTKLVGRKYEIDAAHTSMQLTAYAWAERMDTGKGFDAAEFHVVTKTKSPGLQLLSTRPTLARQNAFLIWAQAQLDQIDAGRFPGRLGTQCNWCGYKDRCPWKKGRDFNFMGVKVPKVTRLTIGGK